MVFEEGAEEDALEAVPMLERYFARPLGEAFDAILYDQYFCDYVVLTKQPKGEAFVDYWIDTHSTEPRYVKRLKRGERVSRVHAAPLSDRERFFFRWLILQFPARSYTDLRTVDGVCYPTYQEAAAARGLVGSQAEAEAAMRELTGGPIHTMRCTLLAFTVLSSKLPQRIVCFTSHGKLHKLGRRVYLIL